MPYDIQNVGNYFPTEFFLSNVTRSNEPEDFSLALNKKNPPFIGKLLTIATAFY